MSMEDAYRDEFVSYVSNPEWSDVCEWMTPQSVGDVFALVAGGKVDEAKAALNQALEVAAEMHARAVVINRYGEH